MEPDTIEIAVDVAVDVAPALTITSPEGTDRYQPVPLGLTHAFAPATHCLWEWTEYRLHVPGADALRIGSTDVACIGPGYFTFAFENQLGITEITPLRDHARIGPTRTVEVLARKFPEPHHSYAFMRDILADLFRRSSSLAFAARTTTGRRVREAHRPPDLLFTYHFFRAHGMALIRALQAIAGRPHQRLSDDGAMVRVHEARSLDVEAITRLLTDGHGGSERGASVGTSILHRLQPERIFQRLPEETFDTPENRFVMLAARRMLHAITALQSSRWFRANAGDERDRAIFDTARAQLRLFTTDRRLAALPPMQVFPTQSRVLQRRDGYRELMELWNLFQRASEPIFERLERAIDLRDVASMYELWVWFELLERIQVATGIEPTISISTHELGYVEAGQSAHFSNHGSLHYNKTYYGYTRIPLRPDYVWERRDRTKIALDAKFRLNSAEQVAAEGEGESSLEGKAKNADTVKMHAYRDAIPGLRAAIVLYPGSHAAFWNIDGTRRVSITIDDVIAGDLDGIGAIPCRPLSLADPAPENVS